MPDLMTMIRGWLGLDRSRPEITDDVQKAAIMRRLKRQEIRLKALDEFIVADTARKLKH